MKSKRTDYRALLTFEWGETSNSGERVGWQRVVVLKEVGGCISNGISILLELVE